MEHAAMLSGDEYQMTEPPIDESPFQPFLRWYVLYALTVWIVGGGLVFAIAH
jgi:hypothetical protein